MSSKTHAQVFALPQAFMDRFEVHLIGLGGTGTEMLDNLVRIHIVLKELGHAGMELHLWDMDEVSLSNIGRTRFHALDVGQPKVEVLASRYGAFYQMDITPHYCKANAESLLNFNKNQKQAKLFVSCTDSAAFRLDFGHAFDSIPHIQPGKSLTAATSCLWLDTGNELSDGQYVLGARGEAVIALPSVHELFQSKLEMAAERQKTEQGQTCSLLEAVEIQSLFINKTIAVMGASLLYDLFKKGSIETHGAFVDLNNGGKLSPLPINPETWAFLKAS